MPETEIIESNVQFREAWKLYAQRSPYGEVFDREGLRFANANQPWAFMNLALLLGPVAGASDLEHRARLAVNYFGSERIPWFLTASADWFSGNGDQVLRDLGLVRKLSLTGMVAERLAPPVRPLPEVEVRRIDSEATRTALADLNADSYGVPREWGRLAVGGAALWDTPLFGTIAYVRGEPASGTLAIPIGDVLYVGWVATGKAYRGQGLAEVVIRKTLEEATMATGLERTVLHATADGYPVYLRLGYRSVVDFPMYASLTEANAPR